MRSSGPGRRSRQFDGRYAYAFWPISSAFAVIGKEDADASSRKDEPARQAAPGWVDEPLLTVVPSAKSPRSRA